MPRPVEGDSAYNPGLDGIRAVAVLGVIAYHLHVGGASGGLLGVGVFFVLSGYLITDMLVTQLRRRRALALGRFWLRRARRLLPALFVMLFVTVLWATLFDRVELPGLRQDMLPAVFYFSNWWYIFDHVSYFARSGPLPVLGHLWSLAIEEQFYLVWPLVLLGALRWVHSRRVLVAGALTLAAASALEMALLYSPYVDPTRVYDGTDTRAFALLIGAALAFAWPRDHAFRPVNPGARWLLDGVGAASLAGILVLYWQTSQYDPFVYRGGLVLLSMATALLIAVCVHPGARLTRLLGVLPLRWVGERSYGMYLWQLPVIVLTTPEGAPTNTLRDVLQVAAIFALSAVSWRFVEQPVRHGALGRWLSRTGRRRWQDLRPGRRGLGVAGGATAALVVFALGLSGAITGAAPTETVKSILPPVHHDDPTTTTAPPVPGTTGTTAPPPPAGQGVTAIGDSIMVDAAPYLEQLLPGVVIDAQVGQQLTQVADQVAQLKSQGDIGTRLILELGTNGYFSVPQLDSLLAAVGPMRRIVLVTTRETRPWEQGVNQTIAAVARSYPGATMVDWYGDSASTPQYFEPDGVHLDPPGAQYYATLLAQALGPPPSPPTTTTTST
ncbi:MAG: acyltransferase family protein, partial [Acidimicrobiales bacterium]